MIFILHCAFQDANRSLLMYLSLTFSFASSILICAQSTTPTNASRKLKLGFPFVLCFNIYVVWVKCYPNIRFLNNRIGYLVTWLHQTCRYIYLLSNTFDWLPPWSTKYDTAKILVFFRVLRVFFLFTPRKYLIIHVTILFENL